MRLFVVYLLLVSSVMSTAFPSSSFSQEKMQLSAEQAILMDYATGRILFEKSAHEQRPIASITKIMTAIIAIENGDLQEKVSVSKGAIHTEGTSIYLQEEEQISLEDLLYGLMLRSGNDAAMAIAEHIGESVEGFTFLMNEKAAYLGMTDTIFKNPHGLHEDGHYSTAYDMALLMRYAMGNEIFSEISKSKSYHSNNRDYKWYNKNKLLTKLYPYCTGGKTGFTKKAGRTLVTSAEKNDFTLIAVTLKASDDWNDHIQMYETYFDRLTTMRLEKKGKRIFEVGKNSAIVGQITEDVFLAVQKEEIPLLQKRINVREKATKEKIGSITYELDGEPILTIPVYANKKNIYYLIDEMKQTMKKIVRYDADG